MRAIAILVVASVSACGAGYTVTIDTSALKNHRAGPSSLQFQLTDGSGGGDGNSRVTLSRFAFGGGGSARTPVPLGSATGALDGTVTLTDSEFINQFTQQFTAGDTLTFTLQLDMNADAGGVPDVFTIWILDSSGTPVATKGFDEMGVDVVLAYMADG